MRDTRKFYTGGEWVDPVDPSATRTVDVVDPATGAASGRLVLGSAADADHAVAAARQAFDAFSQTTPAERRELLHNVVAAYKRRYDDLAQAISDEMGAPLAKVAKPAQAASGLKHFQTAASLVGDFPFERQLGSSRVLREAAGVCALVTPWNWPANQIACKVAPALAAGCTMVLKPSELAPYSATVIAEILHEAGVPPGVFNLVHGDGLTVGDRLARHPEVDLVSLTGSNRAGAAVAKAAADTVKRVSLELGGKSANIILDDADLAKAVRQGVTALMLNTGQNCNAPSRMLVPAHLIEEAEALAASALERIVVGDPRAEETTMGPLANRAQYDKVRRMIELGIAEGAKLVAGGPGEPAGAVAGGFYVRPTIFSRVANTMTIAREEIFGPVLSMIPYADEDDAVRIANDSIYGLSGYVYAGTLERARRVARRLRTGNVHLNGAGPDFLAPFGGYKQSGNGREWGAFGIEEFLETKAIMGYGEA